MQKQLNINYQNFKSYNELNDIEKKLFDVAKAARKKAYAPYSHFLVGCAMLLENGEIISGNNQENAAYPSGLCAERTAIYWASANYPDQKILKIFVVGAPENEVKNSPVPPCGACRQSILEYETKQAQNIEIYFASISGEIFKTYSIKDLLPFNFDVSFL
ncbi:cytidine deaminase [Lonepinella sp. BR2919]|uniref:cytidine deaminase n=1 Tax=unclassified Lonepinella TaxID=2642006 RepID=UPI003F6E042B